MKKTQRDTNPFCFSDTDKRYHTYDYYIKKTFGRKCAKVSLDAGFTCPNIDGKRGYGGCIYCSGRGSGDFAPSSKLSVTEQLEQARGVMERKWPGCAFIPYFQAHTNTYAPLEVLREKFEQALSYPQVVGLSIATRADELPPDVCGYLAQLSLRTHLTVELGLQTSHDKTARYINRCHTTDEFVYGFRRLRAAGGNIRICVHIINGLPGEDEAMMLHTSRFVNELRPHSIKIHSLCVLKNTRLGDEYESGKITLQTKEQYVNTVVSQLELIHPDTVIARLTGDGESSSLLAPDWSRKKVCVINDIDKELYRRSSYQGILCT